MALSQGTKIGIIVAVVVVLLILLLATYFGLKNTIYRINKDNKVFEVDLLGQKREMCVADTHHEDKEWIKIFGILL